MSRASTQPETDNHAGGSARTEPIPRSPAGAPLTLDSISLKNLPEGTVVGFFTKQEKIKRLLWNVVQATLFRHSPRRWDSWRAWLLRKFGAQVGQVKLIRNTVRIEIPWNISIGDRAQIGDRVYLYSLGPIRIGADTVVSQFCHICAGTHDHERTDFPLIRTPIEIGDRCWVATECFIGPGVRVGDGVVLGARAVVVKDLPAWKICVGHPAKPVADRRLADPISGELISPQ